MRLCMASEMIFRAPASFSFSSVAMPSSSNTLGREVLSVKPFRTGKVTATE
jgi:hypothetical protein